MIGGSHRCVALRRRSLDAPQLYGRGLGCLRVVLLRDGRSLPHLRWLLLREALLEQGQHLTHGCHDWKPVPHVETGPSVAA